MATLNIVTTVNSSTNKVRIDLYRQGTLIESKPPQVAPHPVTVWTFENLLPSEVYEWVHVELDSSNNIIKTYSKILVTTPAYGGISVRDPENIVVDLTTGLVSGTTSFIADGTGGKPDWRGWEIIPERIGAGTMYKGVTYSWDKITGTFSLLVANDTFQNPERFFIEFEPKVAAAQVNIKESWSEDLIITDDLTLIANDFDKNAFISGTDSFLTITLPDIFTVKPGKLIYFECPADSVTKCAEITCSQAAGNGNLIMWPFPNQNSLYICLTETIAIYRQRVSNSVSYWRVKFPDGNFKDVGQTFFSYADANDYVNAVEMDGRALDKLEYARLYNQHVTQQDSLNVVAYSDWSSGNNNKKWSFADPSTGLFRVPDLRNLYPRSVDSLGKPGDYLENQNLKHNHAIASTDSENSSLPGVDVVRGRLVGSINDRGREILGGGSDVNYTIKFSGGDEARPKTVKMRLFVKF